MNCRKLDSVTIGNGVTGIHPSAFVLCPASFNVAIDNSYYSHDDIGALYNKPKTILVRYPSKLTANSYVIPDTVTRIDTNAFYSCINLVTITLPSGLTDIGSNSFYGCSGLISINLPSSIININSYAFSNCTSLASITIPRGVATLWFGAFYNCTSLARVYFEGNAPDVPENNVFSLTPAKIYYFSETTGWGSSLAGKSTYQIVKPTIQSLVLSTDGTAQITWTAMRDITYLIQSTDILGNSFMSRSVKTASNTLETWVDSEPSLTGKRFYRIALLQQ
jgi:hypothetical protein